ncbi:hypothetical protein [Methylomonas methanica]|nr:hypothetical protein [Methylomonas methanica]
MKAGLYERDPEGEELSEVLDRLLCPPQQAIVDLALFGHTLIANK